MYSSKSPTWMSHLCVSHAIVLEDAKKNPRTSPGGSVYDKKRPCMGNQGWAAYSHETSAMVSRFGVVTRLCSANPTMPDLATPKQIAPDFFQIEKFGVSAIVVWY